MRFSATEGAKLSGVPVHIGIRTANGRDFGEAVRRQIANDLLCRRSAEGVSAKRESLRQKDKVIIPDGQAVSYDDGMSGEI